MCELYLYEIFYYIIKFDLYTRFSIFKCFILFICLTVSSNPVTSQLSPYLSVDPAYLQNQDEFIPLEGNKHYRGRFELAFSQIGGGYC